MKSYIILIMFMFCVSCRVSIDTVDCVSDWECGINELCNNNICVSDYFPYPSGHILLECGCWDKWYDESGNDDRCFSGFSIDFPCQDFCRDYGTQPYGIMCE